MISKTTLLQILKTALGFETMSRKIMEIVFFFLFFLQFINLKRIIMEIGLVFFSFFFWWRRRIKIPVALILQLRYHVHFYTLQFMNSS